MATPVAVSAGLTAFSLIASGLAEGKALEVTPVEEKPATAVVAELDQ